ncbi:lectin C-type domain protein [Ancylostoma ceylanicum]|uniref:Lectin C-type domain protein n=1 Tax=Ancylostoma ceylanicum TaxID=53326 RepID=A0A0D6LW22_9BILA|nr:lectin C-type domain protein [Ancylostoma ceylanicum]
MMINATKITDSATPCSGWHINLANKHCYKRFCDRATWDDAMRTCKSFGGYLVTIGDEEENNFVGAISHTYGTYTYTWRGARRDPVENEKFVRHDNKTKWEFTNWRKDILRPDDYMGREKCVEMDEGNSGLEPGWNDFPYWEPLQYLCEREFAM